MIQGTTDRTPLEELATLQHRLLEPQLNHAPHEVEKAGLLLGQLPVQPADLIVLAIGVVVPSLCAAQFIAGKDHGDPLR